ncbi:MAG: MgtC/SapB family protein [Vicinamibacterales bacterium]
MEHAFGDLQIAATTALALALGAIIGWDREQADKPAGLRTHALVCGAACMLVSLGVLLPGDLDGSIAQTQVRSDPIRVMEAVITGVSFLGAGTIIRGRQRQHVEGLTTAAAMLATAAIGIAVGVERFALAGLLTALVVLVLRVPSRRIVKGAASSS